MTGTRAQPTSLVRLSLYVAATLAAGGCMSLPKASPLATSPIDPNSPVAADVRAAERAPGPYPRLSALPTMPTDLRPAPAWRQAVLSEWSLKAQTEREAAAVPFTLRNSEAWATQTRARVSPGEAHGAPADAADQAEAFAASGRARATPPPSPK
jgi:hypothetical protein